MIGLISAKNTCGLTSHSHLVVFVELPVDIAMDKGRLSHIPITDNQDFQQVLGHSSQSERIGRSDTPGKGEAIRVGNGASFPVRPRHSSRTGLFSNSQTHLCRVET